MKAIWNNTVIAESNETLVIENNHYFPPESIKKEYLKSVDIHSTCPWKGESSYYDVIVGGKLNTGAAWYYENPSVLAKGIKNYVAFWKGIEVIK
ncbi:MAG: DUF427 domain-containing protein [Psychroserpens sp.]|uniref:DUF427 domain-containing protein n=1 Tax=Psychroserpens sp. TaxID=2020870 RepID=UPI0030023074